MEDVLEPGEFIDPQLHHLSKCADFYACAQANILIKHARRRDLTLRERPAAWEHTLMGDQVDVKLGISLLDAGTLFGDLIVVSSKNVNDTIMAFCEFYGETRSTISTRTTRRS